jgi:hypothetical protein
VFFFRYPNRRGEKSAKRVLRGLLSLLAPPHLRSLKELQTKQARSVNFYGGSSPYFAIVQAQ